MNIKILNRIKSDDMSKVNTAENELSRRRRFLTFFLNAVFIIKIRFY